MSAVTATPSGHTLPVQPVAPARPGSSIPGPVAGLLKAALTALSVRLPAEALEAAAAAAVTDIQNHAMCMLGGTTGPSIFGDLFEEILAQTALTEIRQPRRTAAAKDLHRPLRTAYIAPSLATGQAATDRLINVIERHDRASVEPIVIVAEEFTERSPARRWLSWPHNPSPAAAPVPFERLRKAGCPVHVISTQGDDIDGAHALVSLARSLDLDIAVFIASPACPIQAAAAWTRIAPVQINQNIGAPLVISNMDAILYRSTKRADEDATMLARRSIRPITLPAAGTDLAAAAAARPINRATLGVPTDAILLTTAGNKIPERSTIGSFGPDLARFMQGNPRVWWMPIGGGDFSSALAPFTAAGVGSRVVRAGPQSDIRPYLKAADIYLNEYPEGGSNSVMEAMACGLPVAAIDAGAGHCESIGAQLVGPTAARSIQEYWNLVANWCAQPQTRADAAKVTLARAQSQFGFDALCRDYERIYRDLMYQ